MQLVDVLGSNPKSCRFESDQGHQIKFSYYGNFIKQKSTGEIK